MKKTSKKKWIPIIFITLLLSVCTLLVRMIDQSNHSLICNSYTIHTDKIQESIRIAQITDLHNSIFGEENQALLDLVMEQMPDLILITGDLLNANESRTDIAEDLISNLSKIAPVYVSLGNHEAVYQQKYGTEIIPLCEEAGAIVLDSQYQDIEVNGQQLRLGGIYGYCLPDKYLQTKEADPEQCAFLSDFQNTDLYTILMCHIPVCWLINDGLDEWRVDCVFSGHLHGGQVILPLIGGVYAPDMGWFPGRLKGLFSSGDGASNLVLSTGLGNTEWIPRINNQPEIVTVDILPQ